MTRPKVFVTREIPDAGIKLLKEKKYRVVVAKQDKPISRRELIRGVADADALLSILTDRIDERVFSAGSRLKIVANYAVGFDNIDLEAANRHSCIVTNAPAPEVSESVAEHVVAFMFALSHRIVESDRYTRAGKYHGWGPRLLLGSDLKGKTVGIIGLGSIGKMVAQQLSGGFSMNIVYQSRNQDLEFEQRYNAKYVSLSDLLQQSDYVSLHVPLTKETHHLIGSRELRLMKKDAFLINTSRGPVVDETALVKALTKKRIGGAGLDVYECEPLIDCDLNDKYELRLLDNVVLTPHTASATNEARQAMSLLAAKNIVAVLENKKPITPIS